MGYKKHAAAAVGTRDCAFAAVFAVLDEIEIKGDIFGR